MAQLLFEITNQVINRIDTFKPVAASKNYLLAHFDFLTDEWNDTVTAIFTKNDKSYNMLLDTNNECLVPWELLTEGGDIYVSCFCDNLVTTNKSRVSITDTGYMEDTENSEPPTPNIYDQITNQFQELKDDLIVIDGGTFVDWKKES